MKAVQIGAGNIGRGFLGQLYFESGFETTYIDTDCALVDDLTCRGEYLIEIVDPLSKIRITKFRAVRANSEEAIQAIAEADIGSTAVGVHALPRIVPMLQEGLRRRNNPLDIILAENLHDAAKHMRGWIGCGGGSDATVTIGLVEASVGRMVPLMTEEQKRDDPLKIRVEAFCELPVDAHAFLNPIPRIKGLQPKENFTAYVERKLFLHNAGHATAAYLGHLRSHRFIWQAMEDLEVRKVVKGVMEEACLGLHRKHNLNLFDLRDHSRNLRHRFSSPPLGDTVQRVAADPQRKLAQDDRLIGAINMCLGYGVEPPNLVEATAAALLYDPTMDVKAIVKNVCGLEPGSSLHERILTAYKRLKAVPRETGHL